MTLDQDLVYRLRERARIRRQIPGRKSAAEGKPDRIANLLDEAADEIDNLRVFKRGVDEALNSGDGAYRP
jgi:hypothetical protein